LLQVQIAPVHVDGAFFSVCRSQAGRTECVCAGLGSFLSRFWIAMWIVIMFIALLSMFRGGTSADRFRVAHSATLG
jgi:hypothetical protein